MQRNNVFSKLLLLVLIILIQACGQTGELYLPSQQDVSPEEPKNEVKTNLDE
ncbi:MAG: lipoprotein [Gammaproteobacteria bacterium]|nr:lipoprotein [Gammaproteobacteria bacterium]